ncbi:MAG: 2-oxo acid dehydrogenase subunit E2 [Bdellovibrionales bacterium]|nr:2-oxo acid dehydrogenase subunit E2 [Bdellovibrionales bacterium]
MGKWLKRNIDFGPPIRLSRWRKISMASWAVTHDSSVVAVIELDAEPALAYLAKRQPETATKLTITHLAGLCLARAFAKYPDTNCMVRRGKLYPRKTIDICFLVASGEAGKHGTEDLSGHTLREVDRLGVVKIAEGLIPTAKKIKRGEDSTFRGIKQSIGSFPAFFRRLLVKAADLIMNGLNLWSPVLGFQQDAFGSAMLTSVGSLDIEFAIARIFPTSRNVMIASVGAVREKPVVKNGQVAVGKRLTIAFTGDHRIVDGLHAAHMLKEFQACFEKPESIPVFS